MYPLGFSAFLTTSCPELAPHKRTEKLNWFFKYVLVTELKVLCAWQVSSWELKMSNMTFSSMKSAQLLHSACVNTNSTEAGISFVEACRELMVKPRKNNTITTTLHPLTYFLRRLSIHIWRIFFQPLSTMPSQRKHSRLFPSRNSWYLRRREQVALDHVNIETSPTRLVNRLYIHPHSELKGIFFNNIVGWKVLALQQGSINKSEMLNAKVFLEFIK